jgi:hypothetical protein
MMKRSLFILFFLASVSLVAQKPLKKRFCGEYRGQIGAYKLNTGSQLIDVASTDISVKLRKTDLDFTIGRNEMTVLYTWEKKDKTTLILTFKRTVDESPETLFLYKKTKSIMRVGIFPQPNAQLTKKKKK